MSASPIAKYSWELSIRSRGREKESGLNKYIWNQVFTSIRTGGGKAHYIGPLFPKSCYLTRQDPEDSSSHSSAAMRERKGKERERGKEKWVSTPRTVRPGPNQTPGEDREAVQEKPTAAAAGRSVGSSRPGRRQAGAPGEGQRVSAPLVGDGTSA